jgi:hypothetical protein
MIEEIGGAVKAPWGRTGRRVMGGAGIMEETAAWTKLKFGRV